MVQNLMLALVAVADAFMLGGLDQNWDIIQWNYVISTKTEDN